MASDSGLFDRLRHLLGGDHDHDLRPEVLTDAGAEGIRATQVSLAGLGVTALAQGVIVVVSGSVALASDTVHNLTDALTAIPLWIAFAWGRRPPSRRFTHGYTRAEDLAGLVIVVAIAVSAGAVAWESIQRLLDPREIRNVGWVIAAGLVGAAGNEAVARYRIHVGRRIRSEALVADGYHARTDAYTSLSVVVAGLGALVGWTWADPVGGLVVAAMILVLLRRSAARMFGRLLDAVEPDLVERARSLARGVSGVQAVTDLRLRYSGHRLLATVSIAVDPDITVAAGHHIGEEVAHVLCHRLGGAVEATVHVDPHGEEGSHHLTDHHRPTNPG